MLQKLFMRLGSEWDGFRVDVEEILDCGQRVVALARYRAVYKATGKQLDAQVAHVWTVEDGKVIRFDQYTDTFAVRRSYGTAGPGNSLSHTRRLNTEVGERGTPGARFCCLSVTWSAAAPLRIDVTEGAAASSSERDFGTTAARGNEERRGTLLGPPSTLAMAGTGRRPGPPVLQSPH